MDSVAEYVTVTVTVWSPMSAAELELAEITPAALI